MRHIDRILDILAQDAVVMRDLDPGR